MLRRMSQFKAKLEDDGEIEIKEKIMTYSNLFNSYSDEFIDFTRNEIYSKIFASLKDEATDANKYFELAESVEIIGCETTKCIFAEIARQEIGHYNMLRQIIDDTYTNIKENCLHPLLKNFDDWIENIEEELNDM